MGEPVGSVVSADAGSRQGVSAMHEALIKDMEARMQAAVDLLTREFAGVRTGRANTALLDSLRVEAYGTMTPINQLASVSVPDPEDARHPAVGRVPDARHREGDPKSDLGLTPANDGKVIRLTMPTLTEERRKQLAKTVHKFAEDARVAIRNVRREANDKLKGLAKDKKVSQDEERRGHDAIQKSTDRFIGQGRRGLRRRRKARSSRSRRAAAAPARTKRLILLAASRASGTIRHPWRSPRLPRVRRRALAPSRRRAPHPRPRPSPAAPRRDHHGRQRPLGDRAGAAAGGRPPSGRQGGARDGARRPASSASSSSPSTRSRRRTGSARRRRCRS